MALTDNLISYWKLDGNSNDSRGLYNGTDTAITYSAANGKIIQGAGFDGSTSKVVFDNPIIPIGTKTISFWVKSSTDADQTLVSNARLGSSYDFDHTRIQADSGYLSYEIQYDDGTYIQLLGTSNIRDGTWKFCVCTYDGSVMRVYVNSTLENTSATFTDSGTRLDNLQFGIDPVNAYNKLIGAMDEVGVWSRALTQAEITKLYNNGDGLSYPFGIGIGNFFLLF